MVACKVFFGTLSLKIFIPVCASMTDLLSLNYKQIIEVVLFFLYYGFEGLSGLPKDHRETLRETSMLLNPSL